MKLGGPVCISSQSRSAGDVVGIVIFSIAIFFGLLDSQEDELDPFYYYRSPSLGTKYLRFEWVCPQNGTAVLKGLRSMHSSHTSE